MTASGAMPNCFRLLKVRMQNNFAVQSSMVLERKEHELNSKALAHGRLKRMCGSTHFRNIRPRLANNQFGRTDEFPEADLVKRVDSIIQRESKIIQSALKLCRKIDRAIAGID